MTLFFSETGLRGLRLFLEAAVAVPAFASESRLRTTTPLAGAADGSRLGAASRKAEGRQQGCCQTGPDGDEASRNLLPSATGNDSPNDKRRIQGILNGYNQKLKGNLARSIDSGTSDDNLAARESDHGQG